MHRRNNVDKVGFVQITSLKVSYSILKGVHLEDELHHEDCGNRDVEKVSECVELEVPSCFLCEDELEINHHWIQEGENTKHQNEAHVHIKCFSLLEEHLDVASVMLFIIVVTRKQVSTIRIVGNLKSDQLASISVA